MPIHVSRQKLKATRFQRKTCTICTNVSSRRSTHVTNRNALNIETCMKVINRQRSSLRSGSGASSPPLIRPLMTSLLRTGTLRTISTSTLPPMLMTSISIQLMIQNSEAHSAPNRISRTRTLMRRTATIRVRTPTGSTMLSNTTQSSWPSSPVGISGQK